eukprot:CAMPEP_0185035666 /NCGR_PEP_ID=MMETSP1103-20130426/27451_1 /TAXON_ID=36769 /ORGANISM="Paraphysomonas bandaiensis, Strain Caron Lab Isolate" /LENGTH=202 /DNA_ID=CAMNT_0027572859 /DNA_START=14 /DNA_END=618 /DNA_ORIENTATION=-
MPIYRSFCNAVDNESTMINATYIWVRSIVVKFGLCPWAARDLNHLRIYVCRADLQDPSDERLHKPAHEELLQHALDLVPDKEVGSTLVVVPQLTDFENFVRFSSTFTEILENTGMDFKIQVATFHPDFKYENTKPNSPENWISRSPFPTIHLLKVTEVAKAVDDYDGDTEEIWERNIAAMKRIGSRNMDLAMKKLLGVARNT